MIERLYWVLPALTLIVAGLSVVLVMCTRSAMRRGLARSAAELAAARRIREEYQGPRGNSWPTAAVTAWETGGVLVGCRGELHYFRDGAAAACACGEWPLAPIPLHLVDPNNPLLLSVTPGGDR